MVWHYGDFELHWCTVLVETDMDLQLTNSSVKVEVDKIFGNGKHNGLLQRATVVELGTFSDVGCGVAHQLHLSHAKALVAAEPPATRRNRAADYSVTYNAAPSFGLVTSAPCMRRRPDDPPHLTGNCLFIFSIRAWQLDSNKAFTILLAIQKQVNARRSARMLLIRHSEHCIIVASFIGLQFGRGSLACLSIAIMLRDLFFQANLPMFTCHLYAGNPSQSDFMGHLNRWARI